MSAEPAVPGPALVVYGVSHVDLPVRDLLRARRIYAGLLGFEERAGGEGWLDLDAGGTVLLRLVEVSRPGHRQSLRVQAATVEGALEALAHAGCERLYAPARTPQQELVGSVRDPDGHTLTVWRPLSEDEYDFVPELPKALAWDADAEALLKSLLRAVPALFRALARRKVVRVAEELAERSRRVTREEVVRGFILASPRVTRGRNRLPLQQHGVDVELYQADWDAD